MELLAPYSIQLPTRLTSIPTSLNTSSSDNNEGKRMKLSTSVSFLLCAMIIVAAIAAYDPNGDADLQQGLYSRVCRAGRKCVMVTDGWMWAYPTA